MHNKTSAPKYTDLPTEAAELMVHAIAYNCSYKSRVVVNIAQCARHLFWIFLDFDIGVKGLVIWFADLQ